MTRVWPGKLRRAGFWRIGRARRGAEVLEAALVLPLLLALAFGTVEFGYYFYVEHNLESAAREGARAGIVEATAAAREAAAIEAVDRVMAASGYSETDYEPPTVIDDGEYLEVEVVMHWSDVNAGLRPLQMISLANDEVKGIATMRLETTP